MGFRYRLVITMVFLGFVLAVINIVTQDRYSHNPLPQTWALITFFPVYVVLIFSNEGYSYFFHTDMPDLFVVPFYLILSALEFWFIGNIAYFIYGFFRRRRFTV